MNTDSKIKALSDSKFAEVGQRVYLYFFYAICAFVFITTLLIFWYSKAPENDLKTLLDSVLKFVGGMALFYVLPVALKICVDALPYVIELAQLYVESKKYSSGIVQSLGQTNSLPELPESQVEEVVEDPKKGKRK